VQKKISQRAFKSHFMLYQEKYHEGHHSRASKTSHENNCVLQFIKSSIKVRISNLPKISHNSIQSTMTTLFLS